MRLWIVAALLLVTTAPAFGQATSTFNGRVLDQGDAVYPVSPSPRPTRDTGVVRTTVTNAEGSVLHARPRARPYK